MAKQIKIKEIAEMAGVSAGTVDRILHGRGNVSESKQRAVEAVLQKVGYKFNLHTSAVSLKKGFRLVVTIPIPGEGDYWGAIRSGISKALDEYSDIDISLTYLYYDQFDEFSCRSTFDSVVGEDPDGVIIGPTFKKETLALCEALDKASIPYIFVDADIEGTAPVTVYACDQNACGRTLGRLLLTGLRNNSKLGIIGIERKGEERASNSILREKGLSEILEENGHHEGLVRANIPLDEPERTRLILGDFIAEHPDVKSFAVLNSRGHILAEALKALGKEGQYPIACFDLTSDNIRCLDEGSISTLLCQRPQLQGFSAIKGIISRLLYNGRTPRLHTIPIDIVVKDNLPCYHEVIEF